MSRPPSRQPSTTSLGRYAHGGMQQQQHDGVEFCNSFWGAEDAGVGVLFARMRGATRTMEEMKAFWKERAAIEEDYSKRLAKLAKFPLGRDEIGDIRNCLDIVVLETQNASKFHNRLAYTLSKELEAKTVLFLNDQHTHKKTWQNPIEKDFKAKQTQESYVRKAREKYEMDCMRINAYTAQSTLMQGKELDKLTLKLERAQQTVQANERDYFNFSRTYADTASKWEQAWKAFCDSCQDMEVERLEFIKDSTWAYANVVSAVCVMDDNSCEKLRVALEETEVERDMENFVRDYGTGNQIPDPPIATDYNSPNAVPASSSDVSFHRADFVRVARARKKRPVADTLTEDDPPKSKRGADIDVQPRAVSPSPTPPPVEDDEPVVNMAGLGAAGSKPFEETAPAAGVSRRQTTRKPVAADSGFGPPSSTATTAAAEVPIASPRAKPVDPLAATLEELTREVSTTGSVRRNGTTYRQSQQVASHSQSSQPGPSRKQTLDAPPGAQRARSISPSRDYRNSAEIVVGGYPPTASRPTSPQPAPPAPVFMSRPSMDNVDVQGVLADYGQSLPGERKSTSRRGSFVGGTTSPGIDAFQHHGHSQSQGQGLARPTSSMGAGGGIGRPTSAMGHAGIGAHGGSRSNSPQPGYRSVSPQPPQGSGYRSVSPQPQQVYRNTSPQPPPPPPAAQGYRSVSPQPQQQQGYHSTSPQPQAPKGYAGRPPSTVPPPPRTNSVGIALDAHGRVTHDEMAVRYQQQQQQASMQVQPSPMQAPLQQPHMAQQIPPQPVYAQPANPPPPPPPPPAAVYTQPPPMSASPSSYAPQPSVSPSYYSQPPVQQPPQQVQPPQQIPQQRAYQQGGGYEQQQGGYEQPGGYGAYQAQPQQNGYYGSGGAGRMGASPVGMHGHTQTSSGGYARAYSPQPPPQPQPVAQPEEPALFYVKALYDYVATIDEEFDFQAGDIIAVTSTPEDGWWTGHLLDEKRVVKGKNVFPSNFVCLF
ncbi:hypothetical protein CYLTODRAFT_494555 [Cylindrobasidium torrendii FP15055 ss-10]|uniref:SH3 domain-containing protein n=1 Tax=Cylindrobasidium torrendii FP15055 ss-10 TaxID=1314674 RepID=A0A0D7AVY8_9AGAR|nr:hypothetical protein CYLTODRAFT_494555 [Cylindrobasidium torrendii FP15055 ss-10]